MILIFRLKKKIRRKNDFQNIFYSDNFIVGLFIFGGNFVCGRFRTKNIAENIATNIAVFCVMYGHA
jgi:hypothetical protein